jgi:hypothetical protein
MKKNVFILALSFSNLTCYLQHPVRAGCYGTTDVTQPMACCTVDVYICRGSDSWTPSNDPWKMADRLLAYPADSAALGPVFGRAEDEQELIPTRVIQDTSLADSNQDTTYRVRRFIGLTPCACDEINGLAIGLRTESSRNDMHGGRDSLLVKGIALEIDVANLFIPFYISSMMEFYDDLVFFNETLKPQWATRVKGVHAGLSIAGAVEDTGLAIAPLAILAHTTTGCSMAGLCNAAFEQRGMAIAGLHVRSAKTRGVQLSLYNRSADLRGIQIGLWNKNAKRSLPFINWQFSANTPQP